MSEPIHKAFAYVTRDVHGWREALVFRHPMPEAGIQVPKGTVEPGEGPAEAVLREVREETGLTALRLVGLVATDEWEWEGTRYQRHFFHLTTDDPRTEWDHPVTGDGDDTGMVFHCFWVASSGEVEIIANQGNYLALVFEEGNMAHMTHTTHEDSSPPLPVSTPDPALRRLDRFVGTWRITGRTLGAEEDNISGRVTIEWLPGGYFLQQRGEMDVAGFHLHSLEIVGYDPATCAFASHVYSSLGEFGACYGWDVQGDTVTHWTKGSRYTGHFSPDGKVLVGGWRPDGEPESPGNAYDATMIREDAD